MKTAAHWAWLIAVLSGGWCAAGCAELLGLKEATCDSRLDPKCVGGGNLDAAPPDARAGDTGLDANGAGPEVGAAPDGTGARVDSGPADATPDAETLPDATSPPEDAAVPVEAAPTLEERCTSYCGTVAEACTEPPAPLQYKTTAACQIVCENLLPLAPAPGGQDPLACRFTAAEAARNFGEVESNCVAAGLMGSPDCGEECDVYCGLMDDLCPDQFAGMPDCPAACGGVPRTPEPFTVNVAAGNTLECRFYHMQLAAAATSPASQTTHCTHAAGLDLCK